MVFSDLLLAEIGTAVVMPKIGYLLRTTTITERDVVGAGSDSLDAPCTKTKTQVLF